MRVLSLYFIDPKFSDLGVLLLTRLRQIFSLPAIITYACYRILNRPIKDTRKSKEQIKAIQCRHIGKKQGNSRDFSQVLFKSPDMRFRFKQGKHIQSSCRCDPPTLDPSLSTSLSYKGVRQVVRIVQTLLLGTKLSLWLPSGFSLFAFLQNEFLKPNSHSLGGIVSRVWMWNGGAYMCPFG